MADSLTHVDALGIYHTGATIDGEAQPNPDECLGGYRASDEIDRMAALVSDTANGIPSFRIDAVHAQTEGDAEVLAASSTTASYEAPDDDAGTAITVAESATALLESDDDDLALRITRETGYETLAGSMALELVKPFNSVLGFENVTNAERVAGEDYYHAVMLKAHGANNLTNVKVWLGTLGTDALSDSAQLGAAGAGTITTTGSLADWPESGYVRIVNTGVALREIAYYTGRTATSLTVPAAGRGLLGTSAAAGAGTDTIRAAPGVRIAKEATAADAIQTIANVNTAPGGLSWATGVEAGSGLDIGSLAAGDMYGVWIHREVPAGATVSAESEVYLICSFTESAVSYTQYLHDLYRIEDTTLAQYEAYQGVDAVPDLTAAPDDTSATLPFSNDVTPPGAGTSVFNLTVLLRNKYDLTSLNRYYRSYEINAAGELVTQAPSAPTGFALTSADGGEVDAAAYYYPNDDASPADTWLLYVRANGTNPDPDTDTPIEETMQADSMWGSPTMRLDYALGPFATGLDLRVLARTKRSSDSEESTNTTPATHATVSVAPSAPTRRSLFWGDVRHQVLTAPDVSATVYIDEVNNIYYAVEAGSTALYFDAELVWKLIYNSADTANNGFWTSYGFIFESPAWGNSSSPPVEVASVAPGSELLYLTVNDGTDDVREMKVDVNADLLHLKAFRRWADGVSCYATSTPIKDLTWCTVFQVYDPATLDYVTVCSLDTLGRLTSRIPLMHVAVPGDIP